MKVNKQILELMKKVLQKSGHKGVKLPDFFVLAPKNDPHNCGSPADIRDAEWFIEMWHAVGFDHTTKGIHLRRFHYRLVQQPKTNPTLVPYIKTKTTRQVKGKKKIYDHFCQDVTGKEKALPLPFKMEGRRLELPIKAKTGEGDNKKEIVIAYTQVYLNFESCWSYLQKAAKYARNLELISRDAFIDRRNPPAIVRHMEYASDEEVELEIGYYDEDEDKLKSFDMPDVPEGDHWTEWFPVKSEILDEFPSIEIIGEDGYEGEQRYHLEVWCEKSTMNDILEPLCNTYGAVLQTGLGEMTQTSVNEMIKRIAERGRPARIFYISDFDPKGSNMPVSVGWKIEAYNDAGLDIKLKPLVLTEEQCMEFDLPRIPIKDSDSCKQSFEDKYGEGATELDALEAIYEGTLAEIVGNALSDYYDSGLEQKVRDKFNELEQACGDVANEYLQQHEELTNELKATHETLIDEYGDKVQELLEEIREKYEPIQQEFQERFDALAEELKNFYEGMEEKLEEDMPDLDDYPVPEAEEVEEDSDDWIYDSDRNYWHQVTAMKMRQKADVIWDPDDLTEIHNQIMELLEAGEEEDEPEEEDNGTRPILEL